jgi:hypothetical protein
MHVFLVLCKMNCMQGRKSWEVLGSGLTPPTKFKIDSFVGQNSVLRRVKNKQVF